MTLRTGVTQPQFGFSDEDEFQACCICYIGVFFAIVTRKARMGEFQRIASSMSWSGFLLPIAQINVGSQGDGLLYDYCRDWRMPSGHGYYKAQIV